jgi:hypothetical protein
MTGSRKSKRMISMISSSTIPCAPSRTNQHRDACARNKATHMGWGPLLESVKVLELALEAQVEETIGKVDCEDRRFA